MKDIPGWEGRYSITEDGKVYSWWSGCHRLKEPKKRSLRIHEGYYYLRLLGGQRDVTVSLHRLMALTFIPNPDNKPQVNHIDGNKLNNSISNLEWCTNGENQKHAYKLSLRGNQKGDNNGNSKARRARNGNSGSLPRSSSTSEPVCSTHDEAIQRSKNNSC